MPRPFVLVLLSFAFLLSACTPAQAVEAQPPPQSAPTPSPVHSDNPQSTAIPVDAPEGGLAGVPGEEPVGMVEPLPTAVSPAPTVTTQLTFSNHAAPDILFNMPNDFHIYERQFPSGKYAKTGSFFFRCVTDLGATHYGKVPLPGGLELIAWKDCYFSNKAGKQEKATISLLMNDPTRKQHLLIFRFAGVEEGIIPEVVAKTLIPKVIQTVTYGGSGVQIMGFAIGPVSERMGKEGDFLKNTLDQVYPDRLSGFLKDGKTDNLPEIAGVGRLLIAHKVFSDLVK